MLLLAPVDILSQARSAFTGDQEKYRSELTLFMGPNLNEEQKANLELFMVRWDSAVFSQQNKTRIIDISSQLSGRAMRPVPHFNDFLKTLNIFIDNDVEDSVLTNWLTGMSEIGFNPRFSNENLGRYFLNTGSLLRENVLSRTGGVTWKVKGSNLKYQHDTLLYVEISNATLTCYSQRDSTEIYNATGIFLPEIQQFHGTRGIVTWEKAGYSREDVFVELENYIINTTKNSFTFDSVKLTHKKYFKEPVLGRLNDQTSSYSSPEKAIYPRFETYLKQFRIKDMYKGINYQGGLAFEGANTKGTGTKNIPARISLFRNDTLYFKIRAAEFLFSKTGVNSQETSISLYLDKDSIYHSNLGFSYIESTRQANLFRTNNPVSGSPYFDSFHNLDMYFEYLSWDMDEYKINLSRSRGSAMGQAIFESTSFFNANDFLKLMGIDEYHPLNRLVKFAEWFYSETFPVSEFARWLSKPVEAVTGMCIDLANKGFLFYDRTNNEVTIKQKTHDYLASFAKKKDYDVMSIGSETSGPVGNASLDLKNFKLEVYGVSGVFLSDSQRVAILPYDKKLVIGRNRSIEFDGVVQAGLFTVYGHDFLFNYDTFKIRLQKIDSIRIAVETESKDRYGNPLIREIDNLIQLGTAELYIDNPNNKSGLRSLKQYPIINAITYSYIFYDKIFGLEGIYQQKDFYFKVDPFTYENIDHYTSEEMNLSGEFYAGNILKPMKQYLTIQENNSLGFNMVIPEEGIDLYGEKGKLYDNINMSNKGLLGSGTIKHLTSTTKSDEFKLFPDSMLTHASVFNIEKDGAGLFPDMKSQDVDIKWHPPKDKWIAINSSGKNFNMFNNGTILDGSLILTPKLLTGTGIVNTTTSRLTSNLFSFASNAIRADTADYNLKSPSTDGYAFIADNVKTDINFDQQVTKFSLNTDSSTVKFPELQYICTMTDFTYNMATKVLNMEQRGKSEIPLLPPEKLLTLNFAYLDKPTFFATNSINDTVAFSSYKASYRLDDEIIEAENINYIHIADALIQPENGKILINRRARIKQMENAVIALNNRHILHSAKVDIESTKRYTGSAVYNYTDEIGDIQPITFPELMVDTLTTTAKGFIPVTQKFLLSPAFTYTGDVTLSARQDHLSFTGAAGIIHECSGIKSYNIKFKALIDPKNVMIPVGEKPRDINDNLVFSGSFINTDSLHIYPAFLSAQKSWTDVGLVNSTGFLYYEKAKDRYLITSLEKLSDQSIQGDMIALDKNMCIITGEGKINFGSNFNLLKMAGAGRVTHTVDSGKITLQTILGFNFHFSQEALSVMSDEIRMMPTLKPVNLNSELNNKGMKDLVGITAANQIKDEVSLFGTSRNLPKELNFTILLNEVNLFWNESTSSFRSTGKIGLGFIGQQALNIYVDGYVEIQRRRSGDMVDIYLKADGSTWYYFSYVSGVLMAQSGNNNFNSLISNAKANDRKHPDSSVRMPYTYMIAVEDRLGRFLRRMSENVAEPEVQR